MQVNKELITSLVNKQNNEEDSVNSDLDITVNEEILDNMQAEVARINRTENQIEEEDLEMD